MIDLHALLCGDDPASWAAAGFAVSNDDVVVGDVAIRCLGDGAGSDRWVLGGTGATDVDGIAVVPGPPPAPPAVHPNGVTGLDHVVLRSPDLDRTTEALGALGIEARRTRNTTMGDRPIRQRFFRLGGAILELVGPPAPAGDGPASIWGLALTCPDLDATARFLGSACSTPKDAVQPGRRIATLRTRDVGIAMAVALMSPHVRVERDPD